MSLSRSPYAEALKMSSITTSALSPPGIAVSSVAALDVLTVEAGSSVDAAGADADTDDTVVCKDATLSIAIKSIGLQRSRQKLMTLLTETCYKASAS